MNIERVRARHALQAIEQLQGQDVKNYVSYVKALPAGILQNGLGQAMATLLAAAKGQPAMQNNQVNEAHRLLYDHLETWLCRADESPSPYIGNCTANDLMQTIVQESESDYLLAQIEALAYLAWLKKFAVAYLSEPEDRP